MPKVCVIILNCNGWTDTLECLNSLVGLTTAPTSLVVVDNGSTDQSVERITAWAEERFDYFPVLEHDKTVSGQPTATIPPFLLIRNPSNFGFAGGNNPAIAWALEQNGFDFIWLLNNDTIVRSAALDALLQCGDQIPAGVYGSTIVYAENPEVIQCAGGCLYQPLTTIFSPCLGDEKLAAALQEKEDVDLDYVFGASLFVRTEVFSRCGLLDDDYFLFYEEIDLCKRAGKEGIGLYWCRESVVLHRGSSSVGRPEDGNRKKTAFANYHENLSTLLFTRHFYPWLLPFVLLFRFAGKLAVMGKRGDWYLFRPLYTAYLDFFARKNRRDKYRA